MSANGYLTAAELSPIDNTQFLAPKAATYWLLMRAAARTDGVTLTANEGYRSYARQVYYYNLYQSGQGNPAGYPGTSKHGWGLAVDVENCGTSSAAFTWLTKNAARFGFTWTQGRADNEPWHWVFDGPIYVTASTSSIPALIGDPMDYTYAYWPGNKTNPLEYVIGAPGKLPDGCRRTHDVSVAEIWNKYTRQSATKFKSYAQFSAFVAEMKVLDGYARA